MHPRVLEMDEAQDYPAAGWIELIETLKFGDETSRWRAHGVSRGVRDHYYKVSQSEDWFVHRITAMHRSDWSDRERKSKAELYGSKDHPDYRRNILGLHGDAMSSLFVLHRLMACFIGQTKVQTPVGSVPMNSLSIGDEVLNSTGTGVVTNVIPSLRDRLIRVDLDNGESFYCTPEHPWLTGDGWANADNLRPGDELVGHREAVRLVQGAVSEQESSSVLRQDLRREVAFGDASGPAAADSYAEALRVVRRAVLSARQNDSVLLDQVRSGVASPASDQTQDDRLRNVRASVSSSASDDAILLGELSSHGGQQGATKEDREFGAPSSAGRDRWLTGAAVQALAGIGRSNSGMASAVLDEPVRHAAGRDLRSGRSGAFGVSDDYRSGRPVAHLPAGTRHADRRLDVRARVVGVAILEPGSDDFDRLARADGEGGHVRVYDISVSGHPSFVVGDVQAVVHNCVDSREDSDYNANIYTHIRINDEALRDSGLPIEALLDLPGSHKQFKRVWIGMDVGMTNHPSEILVFGAEHKPSKRIGADVEGERLRVLTRVHLERIGTMDQLRVMDFLAAFYKPIAFGMDRTGLGLPIFNLITASGQGVEVSDALKNAIRGYNFSEKIAVGFEPPSGDEHEWTDPMDRAIQGNVLEFSSDQLRTLVDQQRLVLPWDIDMLREFQGQAYYINRSSTNPYGKKEFNKGKFHALDAARMAALANSQELIEKQMKLMPAQSSVLVTGLFDDDPYVMSATAPMDPMYDWADY